MPATLADQTLAALRRDGYARLGRVVDDDTLATLRRRCDDVMLGRIEGLDLFYQHDSESGTYEDLEVRRGFIGPSLAYRKVERLERDPVIRAWIENPRFAELARAWIGPEVSLYRAMLMNKAANGGTLLPWHQDGGLFWGVDRPPTLQIWTALDDATPESGALEVVPGTHLAGLVRPAGGTVPAEVAATEEGRGILLPVEAGEVILIHNHVWHRSGRNGSPAPRRALSFCYMDAATRCTRTRRAPREFLRVFG